MKILLIVLFFLYRLLLELVYFFGYPLLWLFLGCLNYRQALSVGKGETDILVHAASVGEINALVSLIKALMAAGHKVVINTITVTGRERAQALFPDLSVSLSPLDIPHLKSRQLRRRQVKLILIAETEIWPNMLYAAGKMGIPVLFINARVTPKSMRKFQRFQILIDYIGRSVAGILAQSQSDQQRFDTLFPNKAQFSGNLKFALELPDYTASMVKAQWGFSENDRVLCWGSSRPKEEELLLSILPKLKEKHPNLKVILAPRHPKRVPEIENLLYGKDYVLHSKMQQAREIVVMDTLGKLAECYAICDLAIIGGSFYDFGGHNPLEPAYYSKPIIIGNHHSSCKDSVAALQMKQAILISFKETLAEDILILLADRDLSVNMGQAARKVLTENAAALQNHMQEIEKYLR